MFHLAGGLLLLGCGYSYFVYPLILRALAPSGQLRVTKAGDARPCISVIIAAYNEERRLESKIENTLALDYPRDKLEILICSDCSDDATDSIARRYAEQGVRLLRNPQRAGKEAAQWLGIQAARGECLVFTDVSTRMQSDALHTIAGYFQDPSVGAVSSEDCYLDEAGSRVGEGAYVRYEMWLRRLESSLGGLVGLSGSLFAARTALCRSDWNTSIPSDFATAIACRRARLRAVSAPDLLGVYTAIADQSAEYGRKKRTAMRGMSALWSSRNMLMPWRWGGFSFQLISHKLMRWLVPWFMLALLLVSLASWSVSAWMQALLIAQLGFYMVALLGHLSPALRRHTLVRLVYYFVQVNLALAHALLSTLRGQQMVFWQPSVR